jgi:CheY-like chemotaxis protein
VVALTASCSEEVKARCAEAGMVAHLSKPIDLQRLERVIRQVTSAAASERRRRGGAIETPMADGHAAP